MTGKVLLNIYSGHVRNELLSIFLKHDISFVEARNEDDLIFKYNLIKDSTEMYIQEFDEKNFDKSIELLKKVDRDKVKSILMIHEYSSRLIDAALSLKVKDVIILPIERESLEKKLLSPVQMAKSIKPMPKVPEQIPKTPVEAAEEKEIYIFNEEPLLEEITRAGRGSYPLSLVMVHYSGVSEEGFARFEEEVRRQLRTTDRILKYDAQKVMLVCPFTHKNNLVEVENKVREAFKTVQFKGFTAGEMYLYGVTYPLDGRRIRELIRKLKDGIHDSRLFSELNGPLNRLNHKEVRNRLRRNY